RDGGYYLMGMRQEELAVFQNKNWSTASVLQDTIKDLEARHYSYALLPELSDIDHATDLEGHLIP
ncbi:MAG: glycosyltransferase, partial [Bacteroidota bacterium]